MGWMGFNIRDEYQAHSTMSNVNVLRIQFLKKRVNFSNITETDKEH